MNLQLDELYELDKLITLNSQRYFSFNLGKQFLPYPRHQFQLLNIFKPSVLISIINYRLSQRRPHPA